MEYKDVISMEYMIVPAKHWSAVRTNKTVGVINPLSDSAIVLNVGTKGAALVFNRGDIDRQINPGDVIGRVVPHG